jgi:hypothetical protein
VPRIPPVTELLPVVPDASHDLHRLEEKNPSTNIIQMETTKQQPTTTQVTVSHDQATDGDSSFSNTINTTTPPSSDPNSTAVRASTVDRLNDQLTKESQKCLQWRQKYYSSTALLNERVSTLEAQVKTLRRGHAQEKTVMQQELDQKERQLSDVHHRLIQEENQVKQVQLNTNSTEHQRTALVETWKNLHAQLELKYQQQEEMYLKKIATNTIRSNFRLLFHRKLLQTNVCNVAIQGSKELKTIRKRYNQMIKNNQLEQQHLIDSMNAQGIKLEQIHADHLQKATQENRALTETINATQLLLNDRDTQIQNL